jgi:hypothetical protein
VKHAKVTHTLAISIIHEREISSESHCTSQDASFNLTGTATIMNSPCMSSLTFTGQAIGEAFSLTDAASKARIIAVPTGNNFTFSYKFEPDRG